MKKLSTNYGQHLQTIRYSQQDRQEQVKQNQKLAGIHEGIFNKQAFNLCQILGNLNDQFILFAYHGRIYLIDQHAASQKSLYVRFIKEKNLLHERYISHPFFIENIYKQVLVEKQNKQSLANLGWTYQIIGQGPVFMEIKLLSVPSIFDKKCRQNEFIEIIQAYFQKSMQDLSKSQKQTMATFACHNAYRFGDKLSDKDMRELVDTLFQIDGSFNCPHNRPILVGLQNSQNIMKFIKSQRNYSLV